MLPKPQRGRGVMDREVTARKVLRDFRRLQRSSEIFRARFLLQESKWSRNQERQKTRKSRAQEVIRVRKLLFRGATAPKTLGLLCFGAIREGRMIRDRSLLTS